MRRSTATVVAAALAVVIIGSLTVWAEPGPVVLVTSSASGSNSDGTTLGPPSVSATGRFVAFESNATNLSPLDDDSLFDVYVKDVATGEITLASTSDAGQKGNGPSLDVSISSDGTRVAFTSSATNFDPADADPDADIYVKDLTTGDIQLASTSSGGLRKSTRSQSPALSGDGSAVAFVSYSPLASGDRNGVSDIYLKNLVSDRTYLVSQTETGDDADAASQAPGISRSGTVVAFESFARNLDPGDTDQNRDVYAKDVTSGALI